MRKSKIGSFITAAGVLLILCAAALLLWDIVSGKQAVRQNEDAVNRILKLLPDRKDGMPDGKADTKMPVLEIKGQDYICLIEIPDSDARLPVLSGKAESRPNASPYRYVGTVSDGSLIIGGLTPDFLSWVETDGTVIITDMNGVSYTYTVTATEYADKIIEDLSSGDDDLVLFSANKWRAGYTILRCSFTQ